MLALSSIGAAQLVLPSMSMSLDELPKISTQALLFYLSDGTMYGYTDYAYGWNGNCNRLNSQQPGRTTVNYVEYVPNFSAPPGAFADVALDPNNGRADDLELRKVVLYQDQHCTEEIVERIEQDQSDDGTDVVENTEVLDTVELDVETKVSESEGSSDTNFENDPTRIFLNNDRLNLDASASFRLVLGRKSRVVAASLVDDLQQPEEAPVGENTLEEDATFQNGGDGEEVVTTEEETDRPGQGDQDDLQQGLEQQPGEANFEEQIQEEVQRQVQEEVQDQIQDHIQEEVQDQVQELKQELDSQLPPDQEQQPQDEPEEQSDDTESQDQPVINIFGNVESLVDGSSPPAEQPDTTDSPSEPEPSGVAGTPTENPPPESAAAPENTPAQTDNEEPQPEETAGPSPGEAQSTETPPEETSTEKPSTEEPEQQKAPQEARPEDGPQGSEGPPEVTHPPTETPPPTTAVTTVLPTEGAVAVTPEPTPTEPPRTQQETETVEPKTTETIAETTATETSSAAPSVPGLSFLPDAQPCDPQEPESDCYVECDSEDPYCCHPGDKDFPDCCDADDEDCWRHEYVLDKSEEDDQAPTATKEATEPDPEPTPEESTHTAAEPESAPEPPLEEGQPTKRDNVYLPPGQDTSAKAGGSLFRFSTEARSRLSRLIR
ncbi:hypothetical protein DRE_03386 [Drechslerella stenobrocha 248]|uniref:Uncharacterized protein n=1 Tax=Drechslerella stenobrocha 248 TaxID=1043628 RepID=W7I494_9PEZI|nr:hypothetical protein DRE_03386 [Drechslerella stenobrocha 248]